MNSTKSNANRSDANNSDSNRLDNLSSSQRMLLALKEARSKLEAVEKSKTEPIAIIGIGCRFPGGVQTPEEFWQVLYNGTDTVKKIPENRWDINRYYDPDPDTKGKIYTKYAAMLDDVDRFDSDFFGISPKEAKSMDPQQRLLLEVTWEAIENAAIAPDQLKNDITGVFVGIGQNDYARLQLYSGLPDTISPYDGTGNLLCFASGRLSYVLGLKGPSLAVDTACSSSLVAVHLACKSLRYKECNIAIASGVHLILSPEMTIFLSKIKAISPDGRCKTFDALADGYGRGEGCGVIILKRLSDAVKDKDNILALIKSSAVNHNGPSSGFTVPRKQAQIELLNQAIKSAKLDPLKIGYIEAHGTGTSLGDPIEVSAIGEALCKDRAPDHPLWIGSVKTNIGHLEAAAGIAGLIKIILCFQNGQIPKHVHFKTPNPHIPWNQYAISVPVSNLEWPEGKKIAGVTSSGMSGTNAHIILEEMLPVHRDNIEDQEALFTLSAKKTNILKDLALKYKDYLELKKDLNLNDICFTVNTGREVFNQRLAIVCSSINDLVVQLDKFINQQESGSVFQGQVDSQKIFSINPDETNWQKIAQLYASGYKLDWNDFYKSKDCKKVALPTYVFEKDRYWVDTTPVEAKSEHKNVLVGKRLKLPFSSDIRFETTFNVNSPEYLQDHKLFGSVVVPGASHISMLISCAKQVFESNSFVLEDIIFEKALIVSDSYDINLQLVLLNDEPTGNNSFSFKIISQSNKDDEHDSDSWTVHATGKIKRTDDYLNIDLPNVKNIISKATKELSGHDFYTSAIQTGYGWGEQFQWIDNIWFDENRLLCRMKKPGFALDIYDIHTGLIDSCFQLMTALQLLDLTEYIYIPFSIAQFYFCNPYQGDIWCYLELTESHDGLCADIFLFNDNNAIIAFAKDAQIRKAKKQLLMQEKRFNDWLYKPIWKSSPKTNIENRQKSGKWLIFTDNKGWGEKLAGGLVARDQEFISVYKSDSYKKLSINSFQINPEKLDDFKALLNENFDTSQCKGIVYLWTIDSLPSHVSIQEQVLEPCMEVLYIVQSLSQKTWNSSIDFWIVTKNVHTKKDSINITHAPLWPFAKVINLEHPEINCICINFETQDIMILLDEILNPDKEKEISYQDSQRHALRLVEHKTANLPFNINKDLTYIITGGLGSLGILIARKLIEKGCKNIVLIGRSKPGAKAAEFLDKFKDSSNILALYCDISNEQEIDNAFNTIKDKMPKIAGIIHLAGVIKDALVTQQTRESFNKVMTPKVSGLWNLHTISKDLNLNFFVCFSSAASVVGSVGQSNYAAANGFMDALMNQRNTVGSPGMSINWGPWAGAGMAARLDFKDKNRLLDQGLESIPEDQGLKIFETIISGNEPQVCVQPINFTKLFKRFNSIPMFFEDFAPSQSLEPVVDKKQENPDFINNLKKAPINKQKDILLEQVRNEVAYVLGSKKPESIDIMQGFLDMGMDSLMSVDLRNRLQTILDCRLIPTLALNYPNIDAVADYLLKEVIGIKQHEDVKQDAVIIDDLQEDIDDHDMDSFLDDLDSMSDDDIKKRLG